MKKIIVVFIFSIFFATFAKAENSFNLSLEDMSYEDMTENIFSGNMPDSIPADITPVAAPRSNLKEWTVMIYSNVKDKLRYPQVWQMLEMKKIGSTDKVNVVMEVGMPIKDADGTVSTTTLRMAMGKGADSQYIDQYIEELLKNRKSNAVNYTVFKPFAGDIVKRKKNEDMGDWKNIANFTRWAKANYPAKRYVFVVYGHGTGFFDQKKEPAKGISIDTQTGNYVTLPEFLLLMKATGKVDAIVMQSCLMQMAEVAYQVKDYTDVIVGSGELMWVVGYDFKMMLEVLNSNTNISSENFGKFLANNYVERAKTFKTMGGHASVISSSKLPGFIGKLNDWVDAIMSVGDKKSIVAGIKNVVRFDIFGITLSASPVMASRKSMSGDLYDFVEIVTRNLPQDTQKQEFARKKGYELMDYISNDLIYAYAQTGKSNTGYDFSRAHGVSIHIPPVAIPFDSMEELEKHFETVYWDLPFARASKWSDFLKWMYARD
ncbi:MAG: clostripain-related cysteine peptidase [Elusimicrobia bacterium]|nr:clostripain-related cysteine peptidase [Elusimicrobiota bacterium]